MAQRAQRNKKAIDNSQFGDTEKDDDDFASITVPSSKKSRIMCSESKEKTERQKQSHKDKIQSQKFSQNKIVALVDKPYRRDMEIALALSVNEPSGNSHIVQDLQEQVFSDASGYSHNQLRRVPTKSPTQGLRLGLSRLAKVKPLHPSFANI